MSMLLVGLYEVSHQFQSKNFTSVASTSYRETPQDEYFYKFRVLNRDASTLRVGKNIYTRKK